MVYHSYTTTIRIGGFRVSDRSTMHATICSGRPSLIWNAINCCRYRTITFQNVTTCLALFCSMSLAFCWALRPCFLLSHRPRELYMCSRLPCRRPLCDVDQKCKQFGLDGARTPVVHPHLVSASTIIRAEKNTFSRIDVKLVSGKHDNTFNFGERLHFPKKKSYNPAQ